MSKKHKYYNHDLKRKFIDSLKGTTKECKNINFAFNHIAKLEEQKHTDLADLDNKIIVEYLLKFKEGTIQTYSYYYDKYRKWISNNQSSFVYTKLSREVVKEILNELGYDPLREEVKECLPYSVIRKLINEIPYKQYLLPVVLYFEGIVGTSDKELKNIKPENIYINENTCYIDIPFRRKNNRILVPRSHIRYILDAYKEEKGLYIGESEKQLNYIVQYRDEGFLVKNSINKRNIANKSSTVTLSQIKERFKYIAGNYGKLLKYNNITKTNIIYSGIYYYMSMLEKYINCELNNRYILKIMKRYGYEYSSVSKTHKKYNIYKEVYKKEINEEQLTEEARNILESILSIELTDEEEKKLRGEKSSCDKFEKEFNNYDYDDDFTENLGTQQEQLGNQGEKEVIKMIKDCNSKIDVHKVKNKHHFDILITNPINKLEVKVTSDKKNEIHLSKYELEYGIKSNNYHLVILYYNGKKFNNIKIIVDIKNMYKSAYKLIKNMECKSFSIESENVKISLKEDYIKSQEDFKEWILKNMQKYY